MDLPDFLDFTPVPLRRTHNGWSPAREREFIIALARGAIWTNMNKVTVRVTTPGLRVVGDNKSRFSALFVPKVMKVTTPGRGGRNRETQSTEST